MPPPKIIEELVERFGYNEKQYCSNTYNEAQTRIEFIDPFFEALGWDVNNRKGYSERYKDVIHEDAIKVKGGTKAPDYGFRVGNTRVFFVEAKRPSVNLYDDAGPAFQLRRYGFSNHLPLSILTNFREFAVYDTRTEPRQHDRALVARIKYLKYTDYLKEWDDYLASIFSPPAVAKGSFEKYAESTTAKKGTTGVDDSFLKTIEGWRDALARNFALRNPSLTQIELNHAVQRTIDRILFLRICEDRGIEEYGSLRTIQNNIYQRLGDRFRQADDKYNSGLFHFHKEHDRPEPPDELTLALTVDDVPLKAILRQLYYPCPYEFSVFPADILGQVYEQFLGKVITLHGHRAVVEDKPEVKKAGGVFYTPTYIVSHMTEQTVGALCRERTPKEVSALTILDPACGSGSFLIVAYQYLLDWHLNWFLAHDPDKWAKRKQPTLYRSGDNWRLTTTERKRILLHNIYGVDVDAQAVETTKLSLLLKVLEGETAETVGQNLRLFQERALPDLDRNIKCGNSLISPDLYSQPALPDLSPADRYRINTFDYGDGFPEIMKQGGFDCIIGNPPYVDIKTLPQVEVDYVFSHYRTANNRINLFAAFVEKSLTLLRPESVFSMIVPTAIVAQESYKELRQLVLDSAHVAQMVRLPNESFGAASGDVLVDTVIIVLTGKKTATQDTEIISYGAGYKRITKIDCAKAPVHTFVDQDKWRHQSDCVWTFNTSEDDRAILAKCQQNTVPLEECAEFCLGLTPYDKYKGHTPRQIGDRVFHADRKKDDTYKKLLAGNDVTRYGVRWNGESWISYGRWLGAPRDERFFTSRRILVKQIIDRTAQRIWAALTDEELYNTQNAFNLLPRNGYEPEYLLGIVNSKLMSYYHRKRHLDEFKRLYQKVLIKDCRRFPIRVIDEEDRRQVKLRNDLVAAVRRVMALHCDLSHTRTAHEQMVIERQVASVDREIDRMVYQLYGLDESEIESVENAFVVPEKESDNALSEDET